VDYSSSWTLLSDDLDVGGQNWQILWPIGLTGWADRSDLGGQNWPILWPIGLTG